MIFVLSIGSNAPGANGLVSAAMDSIASRWQCTGRSRIYTTPALDGVSAPYANSVMRIDTDLERETLNTILKDMEKEAGRTPQSKHRGVIPLDIDIVLAGGEILRPSDFAREYFKTGFRQILKTDAGF